MQNKDEHFCTEQDETISLFTEDAETLNKN